MLIFPLTGDLFIDQEGFYPIAIHKKLLRAISPKIGNFARVIKSSHHHVCGSADTIASHHLRKTKRPGGAHLLILAAGGCLPKWGLIQGGCFFKDLKKEI